MTPVLLLCPANGPVYILQFGKFTARGPSSLFLNAFPQSTFPGHFAGALRPSREREDWKAVGDVADLSKSATHKRQGMLGTCP